MARAYGFHGVPNGKVFMGKPKKTSPEADRAYLDRVVKRMNKAAGYGPKPFEWTCNGTTVVAFTRSEARSKFKAEFGISKNKRLPVGILITKGNKVE